MDDERRENLGWANELGSAATFGRLATCRKFLHKTGEQNLDPSHHGYNTLYWCDTCGYEFHVDSSD